MQTPGDAILGIDPRDRLDGWKEIAAYAGKSVRTAQRWNAELGLPVHRVQAGTGTIVYALRSEITAWLREHEIPVRPAAKGVPQRIEWRRAVVPFGLVVLVIAISLSSSRAVPAQRATILAAGNAITPSGVGLELATRVAAGVSYESASPDGRELCGSNTDGELVVHDLATGANSVLELGADPLGSGEFAIFCVLAPGADEVAYTWQAADDSFELRVLRRSTGAVRTVATTGPGGFVRAHDWGRDGSLLISESSPDREGFQILDLTTGARRDLPGLPIAGRGPFAGNPRLSPDGSRVAWDYPQSADASARDVYVLELSGDEPDRVAATLEHEAFLGWLADGSGIFVGREASPRSLDVYVAGTGPQRSAVATRIFSGLRGGLPLGVTSGGELFLELTFGASDLYLVQADPVSGGFDQDPVSLTEKYLGGLGAWGISWSQDGRSLAFLVERTRARGLAPQRFGVLELDRGQVRTISASVTGFSGRPSLSPDGRFLLARGLGPNDRRGLFRVDSTDGSTELLVAEQSTMVLGQQWGPDGAVVYLERQLKDDGTYGTNRIVRREEQGERELLSRDHHIGWVRLSPDGLRVAFVSMLEEARQLEVVELATGTSQVLSKPAGFTSRDLAWSNDGRFVLAHVMDPVDGSGSWYRIPVDGSAATPLSLPIPDVIELAPRPGSTQIAFMGRAEAMRREVQVLSGLPRTLEAVVR